MLGDGEGGAVGVCNSLHQRETQAVAGGGARVTVGVGDADRGGVRKRKRGRVGGTVGNGVAHKIVHRLAQQLRVAVNHDAFGDLGQHAPFGGDFLALFRKVDGLGVEGVTGVGVCKQQKPLDGAQVSSVDLPDAGERFSGAGGVGKRDVSDGLDGGDRRFQLMRGVGSKALLRS